MHTPLHLVRFSQRSVNEAIHGRAVYINPELVCKVEDSSGLCTNKAILPYTRIYTADGTEVDVQGDSQRIVVMLRDGLPLRKVMRHP